MIVILGLNVYIILKIKQESSSPLERDTKIINLFEFRQNHFYPQINSIIYVYHKILLKLKIKLNQTIQRYYGPNIAFTFGNSMELTTFNTFKVNIIF